MARSSRFSKPFRAELTPIWELVVSVPAPRRDHCEHEDPAFPQYVRIDRWVVFADCLGRMGDQLKADKFFWGTMKKAGKNVALDLHLWTRGKPDQATTESYSDNLKDQNDEALKKIASRAFEKLTGAKFAYLPYKSGGEAATQLVGNHTASNVNNPSENLEVWRAGQVRALCVFDKERIAYKTKVTDTMSWNDIPTCKEEGLDMQYLMLRAMFLPGKVTPEQTAFYVDLFKKVTQTPEYKDYMEKQALKPVFLTGKDMLKFLEEDDAVNKNLMLEAGFAQ